MSGAFILIVILSYFLVLFGISRWTSKGAQNETFFTGDRSSKWYVVSFGMIGASLSGVTFLSVPGWVGNAANQFSYMQAVLGYMIGYLIVAYVLLPIYYRMNLISIYEYLNDRFGFWSYKTGASFFLISRVIGASVRLLLVANVLQAILFEDLGIRFEYTVIISIMLIWIYTNKGGIKTIVWTDTLQTAFMLIAVCLTVWFVFQGLDLNAGKGVVETVSSSGYSKIFFFDDINSSNHFLKHFLGGIFITVGMTGLDQDMMQKNLTCKSVGDAKKNIVSLGVILIFVNLLFLGLGALLYMYAQQQGIEFEKSDLLFSSVALSEFAGPAVGIFFLLGLIAAAYSSADSALTSLTTSFSIDFLNVKKKGARNEEIRKKVHIAMSAVLILVVLLLKKTTDESAIVLLMKFAGFTYGPLIGVFFFGIITRRKVKDVFVPVISIIAITTSFLMWYFSAGAPGGSPDNGLFGGYRFGFELIILNSVITFILMFVASTLKTRIKKKSF
jgi:Na+/proline symporter